jgi:glycosyltransferase involved in cell wall biosynthesis
MHVFHVITTLNKGGAETHLAALCEAQRERGAEVTVAYLKGDGYWVPQLHSLGIRTLALDISRYFDLSAMRRLRAAIAAAAPDLVHAHMPPAELYCNVAIRGGATPHFVISKHVDRFRFYPGPCEKLVERFCARPAQRVICISQAVNDYFAGRWPADLAKKLVTIRYGLKPEENHAELEQQARQLRRDWAVADDEVLFGIAARLTEQKSIDTLIRAFAQIVERKQFKARLAIVGQGPLEAELRALGRDLGVDDKIVWAGFHTNIPVVMRAFDTFVLSSIFEGFGLVLLEAMEASRPIVGSAISAIPEIVVDGVTGFLVPPRRADELAGAMSKLQDAQVRSSMGIEGRRRLEEHFTVSQMADLTLGVYEDLFVSAQAK